VFLAPVLLVLGTIILYPILFNLQISLYNVRRVDQPFGDFLGLENYRWVLRNDDFLNSLRVSFTFTVVSVVIAFVLGFAVALLMNEVGRTRPVFLALLLIPWVISPVVTGYSWRWLFNDEFGLLNELLKDLGVIDGNVAWLAKPGTAMAAVIVASVWRFVPYMMVTMLAGLQSVPRELYEAAEVDGASAWSKFVNITISELRYIIGVVLLFSMIWSFNDFALPYIMTQGGPAQATTVLPILVYRIAFEALRFGRGAALAMIIMLFLLVISVSYALRLLREQRAR
jgi:ABC-type sugar transport system permease subunit